MRAEEGCRCRLIDNFCIEAWEEALGRYGRPEIFNSDQGSQFASGVSIKVLKDAEIAISMDGKGAWRDNVSISRRQSRRRRDHCGNPLSPARVP